VAETFPKNAPALYSEQLWRENCYQKRVERAPLCADG